MPVSGDLRISMLIEANASRAKAEVQSMRDAVAQLAGAGQEAGAGMDSAGAGTAEWGSAVQMLRASLQPMVAEANALAAAAEHLAVYEESGALSAREAAVAHDLLARQAIDLQGRMDALGVTLDGTTASMRQHDTAVQQLIARNTGLSRSEDVSIADHLRHGQALDALRAKFDPLFAASRQYELALEEVAEAERLGAISALQAAAARDRLAQSMAPIPGHIQKMGVASGGASAGVQQLGYQLNDIGMMVASGQSPFLLMVQQGPQVVQALGLVRASGMSMGVALRSAFGMFLNPIGLATMAIIGFGAAAVQWFTAAEEETRTLKDAIGDLKDIEAAIKDSHDILSMTLPELYEKYGTYALRVREATLALLDHQIAEAQISLGDSFSVAASKVEQYSDAIGRGVVNMAAELGVSVLEAQRLQGAFQAVRDAASFEDRIIAIQDLERSLAAAGISSAQLPEELRALLIEAAGAVQTVGSLKKATQDAEAAAHRLSASGPRAGWLAGAIADAGTLTAQLWGAATAAMAAAQARADAQRQLDTMKFEFSPGGQALINYGSRSPAPTPTQAALEDRNTPDEPRVRRSGGGGGGGGGRSGPSEAEREITRQREALQDLREEQERQIALLRTTDPVQRIILENHEALAGATEEEKKAVVALILERERLEQIRDKIDEIGETGRNAFTGLISGAHSFSDAISMILDKLADMIASEAWDYLWTGGDTGWGGLSGMIGGMFGLADGGKVSGPGGPRDDVIPAWLSNGEYVVNAAATARNLPLLEALNNGASLSDMLPTLQGGRPIALADGGYIGEMNGASAPSAWAAAGRASQGGEPSGGSTIGLDVRLFWDRAKGDWSAEMARVARSEAADAVGQGLDAFSSHVLPGRMQEISDNPRVVG